MFALLAAALVPAAVLAGTDCQPAALAYVGSEAGQLVALRLDACAGRLEAIGPVAALARPRWAVAAPGKLYVASDPAGQDGRVVAFRVDAASGALDKFDEAPAGGTGTMQLWLDAPSQTLLAAHDGNGAVTSFAIDADGRVGPRASAVQDLGMGPAPRQQGPHAQGVVVAPEGRYALVPDLGADRVFVYAFDRTMHALVPTAVDLAQETRRRRAAEAPEPPHELVLPPGSGPHHLVFGADGRYAYLLDELGADLVVLRWNAAAGRLAAVQTLALSSPDHAGPKSGAELVLGADGRHLYVANRGANALQVYAVDAASGALALEQRIASAGATPCTMTLDASGRWLLVASALADKVSLLRVDAASGRLEATGQAVDVASPLSIVFAAE